MRHPMKYHASRMFSFPRPTKMLIPDRVTLFADRAVVSKWSLLGISSQVKEVLYERISSVRLDTKIFTATVVIETSGGSIDDISIPRLLRGKAKIVREELSRYTDARLHQDSSVPSGTIPPGWYDNGLGRTQWWDGYRWSEHYQQEEHA